MITLPGLTIQANTFISSDEKNRQRMQTALSLWTTLESQSIIVSFDVDKAPKNWQPDEKCLEAIQLFIKICGLLEVFGQILLYCREASYLCGRTGELLLCVMTHHQLNFLLGSFEQLYKTIYADIKNLREFTESLNSELLTKNERDTPWQINYKTANRIFKKKIQDLHEKDNQGVFSVWGSK